MNCNNCGSILQPGEKFCRTCGEKVNTAQEQNMGGQPSGGPVNIVWAPQSQMPNMGQAPDMNQMPNMGQMPNMNQIPNQMPNMGPMPGMEQASPEFARMAGMTGNRSMPKSKYILIGVAAILALMLGAFTCFKVIPGIVSRGMQLVGAQPSGNNGSGDNNGTSGGNTPSVNNGPDDPEPLEEPDDPTGGSGNGNGNPGSIDMEKKGTQNRQEGNVVYVVDGGIYNDTGSYNMDFRKDSGYLNSYFSRANSSMVVIDSNALYYINSALDVEVEAVDVNYGGISYNGNALYYVTSYSNENASLYIVDRDQKKKYKVDESVAGYDMLISPNGKMVAYTKYTENGTELFVAGIETEPQKVYTGYCDIFSLSDDGQLIYGAAPEDDETNYSMYCFKVSDFNKEIGKIKPNRVYIDNECKSVLIKQRESYNLFYYDDSLDEAKLVYNKVVDSVSTGDIGLRLGYMVEIIDSPSLYGIAFGSSKNGVFIFEGPDKDPYEICDNYVYELAVSYSDDICYYLAPGEEDGTFCKYEYKKDQGVKLLDTITVEGYVTSVSCDLSFERLWYCNREGQLWKVENGDSKMITDGADYNYTYTTHYNFPEDRLYFVKDGKLCFVDSNDKITDTGCECDSFYSSYSVEYATCFMDGDYHRYLYIGGRVIQDN